MGTRGRKSTDALATAPVLIETRRPAPPGELRGAECEVWRDTVGTMPLGWFARSQFPLLVAYCRHVVRAAQLAGMIEAFDPSWTSEEGGLQRLDKLLAMAERETRAITSCARAMRLTHQAQIQPRGAGRAVAASPADKRPWD